MEQLVISFNFKIYIKKKPESNQRVNKCYILNYYFIFLGLIFGTLKILMSYELSSLLCYFKEYKKNFCYLLSFLDVHDNGGSG